MGKGEGKIGRDLVSSSFGPFQVSKALYRPFSMAIAIVLVYIQPRVFLTLYSIREQLCTGGGELGTASRCMLSVGTVGGLLYVGNLEGEASRVLIHLCLY